MQRLLLPALLLTAPYALGQTDTAGLGVDTNEVILQQQTPIFTVTADDLDSELGAQDIGGILQSSRDLFTSTAAFNWGNARFRIRGYDGENTVVSINGVLMNDLETNWTSWSSWGGLNDVTRYPVIRTGINASPYNFGGLGGYTDLDLRASTIRPGWRASYAISDRAYNNRVMLTYSSGLSSKGWAYTVSGSSRWAEEGYVEGTNFQAFSYFLSVEKRINDLHSLNFIGFGAPTVRGRAGLAVQEIYDLTGNNFYNPYWGYQNGEKRNSRVSTGHRPVFMLSHTFRMDERTTLRTSAYYSFGKDSYTSLNWIDARDPRPDYYRYLPSYYDVEDPYTAQQLTNAWQNDVNTQQINWDQLYFANGKNLFTVQNAEGIAGNNITGNLSKYILEDRRSDPTRMGVNSVWNRALNDRTNITVGGSIIYQNTHYYKLIDDLLGGDFFVDLNQFAQRDFNDSTLAQSDLNNPNNVVREGDTFGYDYRIKTERFNLFGQWQHKGLTWDTYVGAQISQTSFWRVGNFVSGIFPENSFGKSEVQNFTSFGVKGGATYKIDGRNFIAANAAFETRPPTPRSTYLSPRVKDQIVSGVTNETYYSGDINYLLRHPRLKGRATLYYTQFLDQIWSQSFYHDEFLTLVNYSMTGVDQLHMGTELALEANLTSTWSVSAVYAGGQYLYNSRPTAVITRDNSAEEFDSGRVVYWKNYRVGRTPQTAASLGVKYNSPKFWFLGVTGNYFADMYLDPNPDRRTIEALGNAISDDPVWDALRAQTKLDPGQTVDLFGGKSWMTNGVRIALTLSVNNLLNTTDIRTGGYEQLRYDSQQVDKFPDRYSYLWGRTFFVMASVSF